MLPPDLLLKADYVQPRVFKPRLGSIHVVLWILATAAILGLRITRDALASGVWPAVESFTTYALPALDAAFSAMILVTAGAIVRQRQHPEASRLQPGHWLLVISAALYLVTLPFTFFPMQDPMRAHANLALIGPGVYSLLGAALYGLAASQQPETEWWRKSFQTFAVAHIFGAIALLALTFPEDGSRGTAVWFLGLPTAILVLFAGGSFLLSAGRDLNTQRNRDSLHWLGVTVVAVSVAIQIASLFYCPNRHHERPNDYDTTTLHDTANCKNARFT